MLYGKLIRLRGIEREDIPNFVRWFNDPEVRRYLLVSEPMSKAKEERWFEAQLEARDQFIFAVEALVDEKWVHIGNVGLLRVDWKNRTASLGIALGEKDLWGRGYGTDATRTMLRFAFEELGLHRVELDVFEFNSRAIRCYEKVGFRREGTRRQALFRQGRYHDVHLMAILGEEFLSQEE
jgi:RimJ/RimL family protein N-acetyltransferase